MTSKPIALPCDRMRYRPGPSQPPGPSDILNSISLPSTLQFPFTGGQSVLAMLKVPPGSKRRVNAPNFSGSAGMVGIDCCEIGVESLMQNPSNVQKMCFNIIAASV